MTTTTTNRCRNCDMSIPKADDELGYALLCRTCEALDAEARAATLAWFATMTPRSTS